jgi:phospholipid-binding lipoprotein MlaA
MNKHTVTRRVVRSIFGALLWVPAALFAQDAAAPAAPVPEDEEFFVFDEEDAGPTVPPVADPLEGLNRATFAFNDKLYRVVLKPVARGLRVLPEPVRTSGSNFFDNLGAPVSSVSALLQGDVRNCATELGRFLLNSTAGLAGLFDVATEVGLLQDEEDIGQTLGRYGVGHGFYLVLPFFGSSSLRDAIGTAGTGAINPVYDNLEMGEIIAINFTEAEIALSLDRDTYEGLYDGALDPYAFFRSAWQQNRAGRVER